MKILFADFEIAKYGGIISYMNATIKAALELGYEIDIVQFSPGSITKKSYDKKVLEFETNSHQSKLMKHSQLGGYEKSDLGYWENHYYGFFLPPSNRIGVYEDDALERWKKIVDDVDIILWNFMPTKSSAWNKKDKEFDFWWKFFDLPTDKVKQVFLSHDAYFNVRASNITALKDKIFFIGCAHLASYHCCEEISIPRTLLLNPRYFPDGMKMPIIKMENRKTDFFAAHIFKSMKRMEDLIRAIPHLNSNNENISVVVAGSGIEQAYMTAAEKCKEPYKISCKRDPDIDKGLEGFKIWDLAELFGMEYVGQISGNEVQSRLRNTKFAVDPSWASHYAQYCRTHINGFIIEAVLNGAYPILRDYRGLIKGEVEEIYDPLFENIRAIIIPWDATPKQFALEMKKALNMNSKKYLEDTQHNFEFVSNVFNAKLNLLEVVRLVNGGNKLVNKELSIGVDSENVLRISKEIMTDFFKIKLPIVWQSK